MLLVVYTTRGSAGGTARNGVNRSQARVQVATVAGYRRPSSVSAKASSSVSGGFGGGRGVDRPQRRGDLLAVLIADETQGGPDQVHHAGLHGAGGPGRLDRLG